MAATYADTPGKTRQNVNDAAMVESVVDSTRQILAVLQELHLDDRTLVIFTSDNGGPGRCAGSGPTWGIAEDVGLRTLTITEADAGRGFPDRRPRPLQRRAIWPKQAAQSVRCDGRSSSPNIT